VSVTRETVGVTWETVSVTWETMSVTWETVGVTWETVSVTWETLSVTWETVGVTWETVSVTWETVSVTWETVSVTWETVGVTWETVGVTAETVSVSAETLPQARLLPRRRCLLAAVQQVAAHELESTIRRESEYPAHFAVRSRLPNCAGAVFSRPATGFSLMISRMNEKHSGYNLKASGSPSAPVHLPSRDFFPRVDDHLVVPEVARDEVVGGRRVVAQPAETPHATRHSDLQYVLRAHVAPGYLSAVDLLTRHGEKSDFASDACVFREGVDPATGARHLEEIAFEVVSEQSERDVTDKAVAMHRRGVRRIFAVFVKGPRLSEWSPASQRWIGREAGSAIEDRCLAAPLPVSALLDAALADNAVAAALIAKGNPMLLKREAAAKAEGKVEGRAEGKVEGRAEGMAESVLKLLEARGLAVSPAQREEILRCNDFDRLDRWLLQAAQASTTDELAALGGK
jgi:hypothetical protein